MRSVKHKSGAEQIALLDINSKLQSSKMLSKEFSTEWPINRVSQGIPHGNVRNQARGGRYFSRRRMSK